MNDQDILFDLDSEVSFTELRQLLTEQQYTRTLGQKVLRIVLLAPAQAFLILNAKHWSELLLAALLSFFWTPKLRENIFFWLFSALSGKPEIHIHLLISDESIISENSVDNDKAIKPVIVQWTDIKKEGTSRETENWFLLESERRGTLGPKHAVAIPKKAFDSTERMDEFRSLVNEKMGHSFSTNVRFGY